MICYSCGSDEAKEDNLCAKCPWRPLSCPFDDFYDLGRWCDHCFNEDARDQYCQCYIVYELTHCSRCRHKLTLPQYFAGKKECGRFSCVASQ